MPAAKILRSAIFKDNNHLQQTAVDHRFHVQQDDVGDHVFLIQVFLMFTGIAFDVPETLEDEGGGEIDVDILKGVFKNEAEAKFYGPATAMMVLTYKRINDIVGRSYQTKADAIVGVLTIRHMDRLAQSPGFGEDPDKREEATANAPTSAKTAMIANPQVAGRMLGRRT